LSKKSWVDRAAESGDWDEHEARAKAALGKSNKKILAARVPRDRLEKIFRGLEPDTPEQVDASDDPVQEHVDDHYVEDADPLPSDAEEKAIAPVGRHLVVTVADAYRDYLERGGNRQLPKRVLAEIGSVPVDQLDRPAIVEVGWKLYPKCLKSERVELVYEPLEEIVGFGWNEIVRQGPSLQWDECRYWNERKAVLDAEMEAYLKRWEDGLEKARNDPNAAERERRFWVERDMFDRPDWAGGKPSGPPPDPKPVESYPIRGSSTSQRLRYKLRGQLSALPHGLEFGSPPIPTAVETYPVTFLGYGGQVTGRVAAEPYYGWEKAPVGRPREHRNDAEKMRAYRKRKRARKTLMTYVAGIIEEQLQNLERGRMEI
jgi:hypothetical protein